MLVVIGCHAGDKPLAVRLAQWIAELGGVSNHDCLLAVHKDTDSVGIIEPLTEAFGRVAEFAVNDDVIYERERYVYAANMMWKRTANHIADMNEPMPWLWLEPDAVPMPFPKGTPSWLDWADVEYKEASKPFMHELVSTPSGQRNSGIGIYPARVRDYTDRLWQLSDTSWDVLLSPDFMPFTHHTKLIQDSFCMFGNPEILPTFPDQGSLNFIRKGVVLFHRNKNGTAIDRLRERGSDQLADSVLPVEPVVYEQLLRDGYSVESAAQIRTDREQQLMAEIERLKQLLSGRNGHSQAKKAKPKRTAKEQAIINARMEKMRAARKPRVSA